MNQVLRIAALLLAAPALTAPHRLIDAPIISPETHPEAGRNINGPSLIRVPAWVRQPLGRYYLYFAAHRGDSIRLAWANRLAGPYTLVKGGALSLVDSGFSDHIASPDVIVDNRARRIRLYYHGRNRDERTQDTRVALSEDGLHFRPLPEPVGKGTAYWRVFPYAGGWWALAMPGRLYRSRDGLLPFEAGPQIFPATPSQAHAGLLLRGDRLLIFHTRAGDLPEQILVSSALLRPDWRGIAAGPPEPVLKPERPWEGAALPAVRSTIGELDAPVNGLRDPAIFEEEGRVYLLYSIAGESGIGIAEITGLPR